MYLLMILNFLTSLIRREEIGSIKPYSDYQKVHSHKIKDLDSFVEFLDENQDIGVKKRIKTFN